MRKTKKQPPRIKGPIRVIDEAVEIWWSPPLTWPTEKILDYITHAERGGEVAWKRHDATGEHTVSRPLRAEQLADLAALKRRLHRGGGRPKDRVDALGQAFREAGIRRHTSKAKALKWLNARAVEDTAKPIEERLILEVLPHQVIRWRDEAGEHRTTLRDRLRRL